MDLLSQMRSKYRDVQDKYMRNRKLRREYRRAQPAYLYMQILDLGLARVEDPTMTLNRGTRLFFAPETHLQCIKYSAAVDIWAVGCIFVSLFTRTMLFEEYRIPSSHSFTIVYLSFINSTYYMINTSYYFIN